MRLTSREQEIFEVLRKEPLISQEDLARRFGISRSSAAVHISNLMKKGAILGKGYVVSEEASVAVIGDIYLSIEVDETGQRIDIDHKGSALVLSAILAGLGIVPKVMTVIGGDELGTLILTQMQQNDIDTSNVIRLADRRTCRRIYADDRLIYEEGLSEDEVQKAIELRAWAVFNCEYLIVDPGCYYLVHRLLSGKGEERLPQLCTYGFPSEEQDITKVTGQYSVIAWGISESSALDDYITKCFDLVENDQQLFVLTDGFNRLVYINSTGIHDFPLLPGQAFDCQQGVPRLLAGLVYGLSKNYPARQAVRIGVGAASSSNK